MLKFLANPEHIKMKYSVTKPQALYTKTGMTQKMKNIAEVVISEQYIIKQKMADFYGRYLMLLHEYIFVM